MKVAIAIPVHRTVEAKFAESLANMTAATAVASITYNGAITKPLLATLTCDEGGIEYKRTKLALRALQAGADCILWADSDHTFSSNALLRLLRHDLPIVGANYRRRMSDQPSAFDLDGKPFSGAGDRPIEAGAIGLGFCLTKTEIFATLPHPWFASEITATGELRVGEDVHFCNQARSVGIPVHVDPGLRVGHIASQVVFNDGETANAGSVLSASGP